MCFCMFIVIKAQVFYFILFCILRYQIQIKLPFYVYRFSKLEILFFFISPPWFQKKIEFGIIFNDLHHHQNKAKLAGQLPQLKAERSIQAGTTKAITTSQNVNLGFREKDL